MTEGNSSNTGVVGRIQGNIRAAGKDPELERRAENVQILAAIGILTVSGTLYVNNQISFPLLESVGAVSYVQDIFRYFVYLTIIFVASKVVTITIYPITENNLLLWVHDRFEPFLYVFSPLLLTIAFLFAILIGQIGTDIIVIVVSLLGAAIPAYLFSKRAEEVQKEEREEAVREQLTLNILYILIGDQVTEEDPMKIDELVNMVVSQKVVRDAIDELASDPSSPVETDNEYIWLSDVNQGRSFFVNYRDNNDLW